MRRRHTRFRNSWNGYHLRVMAICALVPILAILFSSRADAFWGTAGKGYCPHPWDPWSVCDTPIEVCEYFGSVYINSRCIGITDPLYNYTDPKSPFISGFLFIYTKQEAQHTASTHPVCEAWERTDALSPSGCSLFTPPPSKLLGSPPCNTGGSVFAGNPVNVTIGNKVETVTDYRSAGPDQLVLSRTYNSQGRWPSVLGYGWQTNFDRKVVNSYGSVVVARPDGRLLSFAGSGPWTSQNTDVDGRLGGDGATVWTFTDTDDTVETFDYASGRLLSIRTRSGYEQVLAYDAAGAPTSVTDSHGRQLTFSVVDGVLRSVTDPDGRVITYSYDQAVISRDNRLIQVVPPGSAAGVRYLYEDATYPFALTGIVDESGTRFASWTYDAQLRVVSSQHAGGAEATTLSYGQSAPGIGTVLVTNALGRQATYTFTKSAGTGRLTTMTETGGTETPATAVRFTYDSRGYLASRTDENGVRSEFTNDSRGLVLTRTDAAGTILARTTTFTWDSSFHLPLRIAEPGRTSDFAYDLSGRLLERKVTDTATGRMRAWHYAYSAAGLLLTMDGPRTDVADVTTYAYDPAGLLASATDAAGHVTRVTSHDASGRPLIVLDANDVATTFAYDERGRPVRAATTTSQGEVATTIAYDVTGRVNSVTTADGLVLTYGYDAAGRLVSVANQAGERIDYTVDALGNVTHRDVVSATGAVLRAQSAAFDGLGRLIRLMGGSGQTFAIGWDLTGNPVSATDPLGRVTQMDYDALARVVSVTDALGGHAGHGYDVRDWPTSATDPRGLVTTYGRDGFGDVVTLTSPDTGTTAFETDAAGNIVRSTDARGVTTEFAYDALDRPTSRHYPAAPAESVTFVWDESVAGSYGIGRLTSVADADGSTAFGYDELGRVVRETRTAGGNVATTAYGWTPGGALAALTYPSGRTVTYVRDGLGRVASISTRADAQAAPQVVLSDVAWQAFGGPAGWRHGNGLTRTVTFDQDGRIATIVTAGTGGPIQNLTYGRDAAGNVTTLTDAAFPDRSQNFTYDALHRVVSAEGVYGSVAYGWDGVGNRLSRIRNGQGETATYDTASNRLLAVAAGGVTRSCGYSPTGSLVEDDNGAGIVAARAYDQADRLVQLTRNDAVVATYGYDGFGRRVGKNPADGTASRFSWFGSAHILAESSDAGALVEVIRLGDTPVAMVMGATLYHLHVDALGTPAAATDDTGTVVWDRAWAPFGEDAANTGPLAVPLRFPGQWQDTESGTAYNVSRDYDPSLGRYLQSDAAGLDGGWNTYAYAGGNPVNAIDPDGRNPLLLGMLAFLAYELTAQPANAPGPGEALLTPSPWAPATNALAVAGMAGAGGLGNCVAARKVGRYLFNARAECQSSGRCTSTGPQLEITFGRSANQEFHTVRHLEGYDVGAVKNLIREDIGQSFSNMTTNSAQNGWVNMQGTRMDYTVYRFQDGSFNVGRITPPR